MDLLESQLSNLSIEKDTSTWDELIADLSVHCQFSTPLPDSIYRKTAHLLDRLNGVQMKGYVELNRHDFLYIYSNVCQDQESEDRTQIACYGTTRYIAIRHHGVCLNVIFDQMNDHMITSVLLKYETNTSKTFKGAGCGDAALKYIQETSEPTQVHITIGDGFVPNESLLDLLMGTRYALIEGGNSFQAYKLVQSQ
jgi:hypothetical protein